MLKIFSFERFIYPDVAKILFVIGTVVIAIGTLIGFFSAFGGWASFGVKLLTAAGALLSGALSVLGLRILTELILVVFSIHDTLKEQLALQRGRGGAN